VLAAATVDLANNHEVDLRILGAGTAPAGASYRNAARLPSGNTTVYSGPMRALVFSCYWRPPFHLFPAVLTLAIGLPSVAWTHAPPGANTQTPHATASAWVPDNGDGTYRNPVIFADYSDPDVVRAGDDFYMVSSSFHHVPGLPILHSTDLVNWTIVGHALDRLPSPVFDTPQHGKGIWAPSIRHHGGYFWIYVGDPDLGILMTRARDPRGPWENAHLVKEARGWIDPCPLWDADGQMYLVHAWAKSRAGFNGVLTVNRLSADGRQITDEGVTVFDGRERHPTIEGPKFYERNGYYYIFAPAGGVTPGWQTVLRSRNVLGPYEDRIVLDQGKTPINGPHQGGWVDTPGGEDWFVHFQDRGAFGRVVHLQPMVWKDDWPVMGEDPNGDGRGQPVLSFRKPRVNAASRITVPETSDEFDGAALGLQWQWHANPLPAWWSLSARTGTLRLVPESRTPGQLWEQASLLLQKFPAERFTATTEMTLVSSHAGARSGLAVMGRDYAFVVVERTAEGWRLVYAANRNADKGEKELVEANAPLASGHVWLRASVGDGARTTFSYSADGKTFTAIGTPFTAREGVWVGARVGVFTAPVPAQNRGRESISIPRKDPSIPRKTTPDPYFAEGAGHTDVEWFRIDGGR
jgi:beta-xylosidase